MEKIIYKGKEITEAEFDKLMNRATSLRKSAMTLEDRIETLKTLGHTQKQAEESAKKYMEIAF